MDGVPLHRYRFLAGEGRIFLKRTFEVRGRDFGRLGGFTFLEPIVDICPRGGAQGGIVKVLDLLEFEPDLWFRLRERVLFKGI